LPKACCPWLDSLEAGLAIKDATPEQLREGADATLRQLRSALERNKVLEINPPRAPSSTRTSTRPSAWCRPTRSQHRGHRAAKGLLIAERVLRPALVTVAPQINFSKNP
jgi:molecular chaperone GrpE